MPQKEHKPSSQKTVESMGFFTAIYRQLLILYQKDIIVNCKKRQDNNVNEILYFEKLLDGVQRLTLLLSAGNWGLRMSVVLTSSMLKGEM